MYCNFTKSQSLPLSLIRVSSQPKCFKSQFSSKTLIGSHPKPSQNPNLINFIFPSTSCYQLSGAKAGSFTGGLRLKSGLGKATVVKVRGFSSVFPRKNGGGGKSLPWLTAEDGNEMKKLDCSVSSGPERSSWVDSAEMLEKEVNAIREDRRSSWKESNERLTNAHTKKAFRSSWDEAALKISRKKEILSPRENEDNSRKDVWYKQGNGRTSRTENIEESEKSEAFDDDRRRDRTKNGRGGYERPEVQRWNNQENWGRKTLKEASESSVPNMVGEGIYGVGPVLAALSAGRREFYVLYVQEGLELSSTRRKKKDKKGFEKVLNIAEKIGISLREIPKHDLNMISDNRPHQGLVLDASPLEMVGINKLDTVSENEKKNPLWVALDEVTDPQNLGAIIRSAYFFGASGVVLCAKNSAPLSGVVSKASAGSLELMELRYCKNMMQFLTSSIENGWRVLGGSVSPRSVPLNRVSPGEPTILVLGSEGTGLRPLVERSCTDLIKIPGNINVDASIREDDDMNYGSSGEDYRSFMAVESLNVSVAAGVLIHHLIGNCDDDLHVSDDQTELLVD